MCLLFLKQLVVILCIIVQQSPKHRAFLFYRFCFSWGEYSKFLSLELPMLRCYVVFVEEKAISPISRAGAEAVSCLSVNQPVSQEFAS